MMSEGDNAQDAGRGDMTPAHDDDATTGGGAFVARFARLALDCVAREYPNMLAHVLRDASHVKSPRELHPAFYGCYDWHSAVHGHWLLVHLLRTSAGPFAAGAESIRGADIRRRLDANLTPENIAAEDAYFRDPGRPSYERPYGWAWLLKLHEELYLWDDPDARRWFEALSPLAATIVAKYLDFFPRQKYPVRVGTHFNTAFGLGFAWDYAATLTAAGVGGAKALGGAARARLDDLRSLVEERARAYFGADADCPAAWEPSGDDFLSPCLSVADLMRRVLPAAEFARWFAEFLPGVARGEPRALLHPAEVTDRADPKIVHLDGLNLSRAWCLRGVAHTLGHGDPRRAVLASAAARHAAATLGHVLSGDYAGEHWLATFAVYMLSIPEPEP
jgi:hypothetical protein